MIQVDWAKLGNCPECGAGSLDLESEDRIACNYYVYCLDCRYSTKTALGPVRTPEDRQALADQAAQYWYDRVEE